MCACVHVFVYAREGRLVIWAHSHCPSCTAVVCGKTPQGVYHQALLGDLNTMAHGIARLARHHCNDRMRLRSFGMDEASVWTR
jgi:hypothetical protein